MMKYKKALLLCLVALILLSSGLFVFQSGKIRLFVKNLIEKTASDQGITFSLDRIEGRGPLTWVLSNVKATAHEAQIEADRVEVHLSPLSLLWKTLNLKRVVIDHATVRLLKTKSLENSPIETPAPLPSWHLYLGHLQVKRLLFHANEKSIAFKLSGKGKYRGNRKTPYLDILLQKEGDIDTSLDILICAGKRADHFGMGLALNVANSESLQPLISLPYNLSGRFVIRADGPFKTYQSLLTKKETDSKPLQGQFEFLTHNVISPQLKSLGGVYSGDGFFAISSNKTVYLSKITLKSPLFLSKLEGSITSSGRIERGSFSLKIPKLKKLSSDLAMQLEGNVDVQGCFENGGGSSQLAIENLKIENEPFDSFVIDSTFTKKGGNLSGEIKAHAAHSHFPFKATIPFAVLRTGELSLPSISATMANSELSGNLTIHPLTLFSEGLLYFRIHNLGNLHRFFPRADLRGSVGANIELFKKDSKQSIRLSLDSPFIQYNQIHGKEIELLANFDNVLDLSKGHISFESRDLSIKNVELDSCKFDAKSENDLWPFSLSLSSLNKNRLFLDLEGTYRYGKTQQLTINKLVGSATSHPFRLESPTCIELDKRNLILSPFKLFNGNGFIEGSVAVTEKGAKGRVSAKQFPIDFLAIHKPEINFQGSVALHGDIDISDVKQEGKLQLLLEKAAIKRVNKKSPFSTKGSVCLALRDSMLQCITTFTTTKNGHLDLGASFPVDVSLAPFSIGLNKKNPISGRLVASGTLKEILDIYNIGPHELKGDFSADLHLCKTLAAPSLIGKVDLTHGSYESYYTGSKLDHLEIKAEAVGKTLTITHFAAKDKHQGNLSASGKMGLLPDRHFPYELNCSLDNLQTIRLDTIRGNLSGDLSLSGDMNSGLAKGDLEVPSAEIILSGKIPLEIPDISYSFINPPIGLELDKVDTLPIYPLQLNLKLHSPGKMILSGFGLSSEWKADLDIDGKSSKPMTQGKCTLIQGTYVFAGKTFTLNEGTIIFDERSKSGPYLNLKGSLELPGATIVTLNLRGPLFHPSLDFTSSPYLPTSSILSLILFSRTISEISPIEALQLAQLIVSLSAGNTMSVLDVVRQNLGIDKLNIVPAGPRNQDVMVQIGKYLIDGVMVTLSQSVSSANKKVEVELKKGFVLEAESQEEEEGKFTFKWNYNY